MKGKITFKGGSGSGNFGHSGRKGKVGGSSPGGKISGDDAYSVAVKTIDLLENEYGSNSMRLDSSVDGGKV